MTTDVAVPVFTAWPVVASAVTVAGALVVVILTHYFTRKRELQMLGEKRLREKEDAEEKRLTEFRFISVALIFRLEEFAVKCADVAGDYGKKDKDGDYADVYPSQDLTVTDIEGDWKSLPSDLMYQILELPVLRQDAVLRIRGEAENLYDPPEHRPAKEVRQKYYAQLGIKACELVIRLRSLSEYPESPLVINEHSALGVMRNVIRREEDKERRESEVTEI